MNKYFDSTATSKPSQLAIETFVDVSVGKWYNPSSISYEGGGVAKELLREAREITAECIGAEPEQVIFTSGATEGANWILQRQISEGDNLIVSKAEHPAVYETAIHVEEDRNIYLLNVCSDGCVAYEDLEECLEYCYQDRRKTLVAIMDSNNEVGSFNDTRILTELSHRYPNTEYFCDMTQSFAHAISYDVKDLDVDYAIASAQKFGGFKGTGFLYAKNPDRLTPFMYGGHQEYGKRPGTEHVAAIYASAKQFQKSCKNRRSEYEKIAELFNYLAYGLKEQGWIINGSRDKCLPNIVSATYVGLGAQKLIYYLGMDGFSLSAGSACSSGEDRPSRILKAMGMSDNEARGTIRISLDTSHTKQDIDYLLTAIHTHTGHLVGGKMIE